MAVGDVYTLADQVFVNPSDFIVVVFHLRDTDGAGSPTDLLTKWLANGWYKTLQAPMSQDVTYDSVTTRKLIPYGSGSIFASYPGGTVGGRAVTTMALNSAFVTSWYTGLIGRSKRGRTFTSGLPVDVNVKGLVPPATLVILEGFITTFFNYWKTGGGSTHYELGVWSRKIAGPNPPFNPAAFVPITLFTARQPLRSQRRRNFGVSISRHA